MSPGLCGCMSDGPSPHFSRAGDSQICCLWAQRLIYLLPGLKFSIITSDLRASCLTSLTSKLMCYKRDTVHVLSTLFLAHIDSNALLVAGQTPKPWAYAIDIELAPDTQCVACMGRFDLDDFCTEMSRARIQCHCRCAAVCKLRTRVVVQRKDQQ